jgi:UDP-glucose 4-epimerase
LFRTLELAIFGRGTWWSCPHEWSSNPPHLLYMKHVLITGGAGYIGSHTVVELVKAGYIPVVIDDFSNSEPFVIDRLKEITGVDFPMYSFDCCDSPRMREVFSQYSILGVIHFAAFKAVGESVEQPLKYFRNNLDSLMVVLECMQHFGVQHLVFSSSCTVYGQPDHNPVLESAEWKTASSPYGYTKQACERLILDLSKAWQGLNACLLRYFNPVGAHPSARIGELPNGVPNNLVPFITQTAAGLRERLTIFGNDYATPDGTCIRDFIHVVDLAEAHVAALHWCQAQRGRCDAFNIGQGKGNSVLEAVQSFVRVTGAPLNYAIGPRRPGDIEQVWADVSKAQQELKWKTRLTLDDALLDAWKWQQSLPHHS